MTPLSSSSQNTQSTGAAATITHAASSQASPPTSSLSLYTTGARNESRMSKIGKKIGAGAKQCFNAIKTKIKQENIDLKVLSLVADMGFFVDTHAALLEERTRADDDRAHAAPARQEPPRRSQQPTSSRQTQQPQASAAPLTIATFFSGFSL